MIFRLSIDDNTACSFPNNLAGLGMKNAILFPGQGSQSPGMCNRLYHTYHYIRSLWEEIDDGVGFALSRCILEGDATMLQRTSVTQPALFTASFSVWKVLKEETDVTQDVVLSGHSVGEYAALVAAGCIDVLSAARLLALRGKYMESSTVSGGLLALIGGDTSDVNALIAQANAQCNDPCMLALCNAPGQHVVGGPKKTLEVVATLIGEYPIKRAMPLSVSGPFHTPYMQEAQDLFTQELQNIAIAPFSHTIISSVTGGVVSTPEEVKSALARQTVAPVLWAQAMQTFVTLGVTSGIEAGPGSVLTNLVKRSYPDVAMRSYEEVL